MSYLYAKLLKLFTCTHTHTQHTAIRIGPEPDDGAVEQNT